MRNIVFLDFDSVLNSQRTFEAFGTLSTFDPIAVRLVSKLCNETEAEIIISSSWRVPYDTVDKLLPRMAQCGAAGLATWVVGMTPWLPTGRGDEIAAWLNEHSQTVLRYVILDDHDDTLPGQRLVKTDSSEGFNYSNYIAAREILDPGFEKNIILF